MINYVYVWFANFRLRFLGCLDWNICFTQIFFSILISVWSFQCTHSQIHSFMFLTEWRWRDSNSWPPACKAGALPTELHPHLDFYSIQRLSPMGLSGLEPPTSRLSGVRSNRLSYKPISIWQPPAFPYRHQYSIIGRFRLNHRVRDVDGCFPKAHRHQKFSVIFLITQQWITFTRFP